MSLPDEEVSCQSVIQDFNAKSQDFSSRKGCKAVPSPEKQEEEEEEVKDDSAPICQQSDNIFQTEEQNLASKSPIIPLSMN